MLLSAKRSHASHDDVRRLNAFAFPNPLEIQLDFVAQADQPGKGMKKTGEP
jgi:hypothetical protein